MYTRKIKTHNISNIFSIISITSIIFTSLSVSHLLVINHSYTFTFYQTQLFALMPMNCLHRLYDRGIDSKLFDLHDEKIYERIIIFMVMKNHVQRRQINSSQSTISLQLHYLLGLW